MYTSAHCEQNRPTSFSLCLWRGLLLHQALKQLEPTSREKPELQGTQQTSIGVHDKNDQNFKIERPSQLHETGAQNNRSLSGRFRARVDDKSGRFRTRLGDKRKGRANTCHIVLTTYFANLVRSNWHSCSFRRADCCCPLPKERIIPLWCHSALNSMQLWRQLLGHSRLCQPGEFVRHFIEFTWHMLCDDFSNVVQLEHQRDLCSNPI